MKRIISYLIVFLFLLGCGQNDPETRKTKLPDATGKTYSQLVVEIDIPHDTTAEPNSDFQSNVKENEKLEFTLHRKFSTTDIELARKAVKFVETLTGVDYDENYDNYYWSDDLMKFDYLGMTLPQRPLNEPWNAYIVIASEIKPVNESNLNEMRDLGLLIVHEGSHAKNKHPEILVRELIDSDISVVWHTYFHTDLKFYNVLHEIGGKPKFKTLLEQKAYEAGIAPPYFSHCDWGDSLTYQLPELPQIPLMLLRPTNSVNNP